MYWLIKTHQRQIPTSQLYVHMERKYVLQNSREYHLHRHSLNKANLYSMKKTVTAFVLFKLQLHIES
jgi:hypothetical protein